MDSPRVGQMIQGYADHGEGASPPILLFRGGSGVERSSEECMGKGWGWGIEGGGGGGGGAGGENSGRGTIVEVFSGSPQYVLRLAAHAMLEQEHRWFTHGVRKPQIPSKQRHTQKNYNTHSEASNIYFKTTKDAVRQTINTKPSGVLRGELRRDAFVGRSKVEW